MEMSVVRELPENSWRAFVAEHPQGNIFHTPEMFQLFEQLDGHHPELWAVVERDQILALMLPVRMSVLGGVLRRFTSRSVVLNRLLYLPQASGQAALDLLLQTYKHAVGTRVLFTRIYNTAGQDTLLPVLAKHGFETEAIEKYVVPLTRPAKQVFQKFHRRIRNYIRRGEKRGDVVIETVTDKRQLTDVYQLLCCSADDKNFAMADFALFESAFDLLHAKGMIKFTLARVGQSPAAVSVDLLYKDVVVGWYGGMDRAYCADRPNELLMWHVLKWSADHGYRLYDFGGSGIQEEGEDLSRFKVRFGSQAIPYGRHTYMHIPFALQLSEWGYWGYQQIRDMTRAYAPRRQDNRLTLSSLADE